MRRKDKYMSWEKDLAVSLLPLGLIVAGGKLRDKDANDTGLDDAFGKIMIEMSPVVPSLVSGGGSANAGMKAMRIIEQVAHAYRVSQNDPTL
jgi:hypothetical protein